MNRKFSPTADSMCFLGLAISWFVNFSNTFDYSSEMVAYVLHSTVTPCIPSCQLAINN
jgi:hypothetical protein